MSIHPVVSQCGCRFPALLARRVQRKPTFAPSTIRSASFVAALFAALAVGIPAAAQQSPAGFDDLAASATAARERGDLSQAIELYRGAVDLNPEWPDGWWYLGSLQYGANAYAPARDALTRYIALAPKGAPAFALRGLCEFETAQYPESLADLQHALSLGAANQPRNEGILRYHEALLLTHAGRFEEALRSFAFFCRAGAEGPPPSEAIGLAGLRTAHFPAEIDSAQAAQFTAAGDAACSYLSGDWAKADQDFQDYFQRYPTSANAHYLYGYLLFTRDPDRAVAEFKREVAVNPSSVLAHSMLAWTSLLHDDFAGALPNAEKAVAEDPSLPLAQLVLGRSLIETGDLKTGMAHLETAQQLEPGNLEVHLALVKVYSESGRKDDARRERLRSLEISKQEASALAGP